MRCKYCGILQDEPQGAKVCVQCGGELAFPPADPWSAEAKTYIRAQLELDQIAAPCDQPVERYLVLTIETPVSVPAAEQTPASSGRGPLHFVAVLDVSGSMRGDKIAAAIEAVRQAAQRLQDQDLFTLVTFATDVQCPLSCRRVNASFRRVIASSLQEIQAGGQTALCGGLELGIQQVVASPGATNLVLLVSDGQANVGETEIEAIGRRAIDARARAMTVSTLGVGQDYNEALMAEIAIDGGGRFYHIADASRIAAYLTGELGEVASLAARDLVVDLRLPAKTEVQTLSAAYPVRSHTVALGDIPLATTLEVVIRLLLPPHPSGSRLPLGGVLSYITPAGNKASMPLNDVTLRYQSTGQWTPVAGAVKPIVRRVLDHMQAAGVLAISRAATHSPGDAQQRSQERLGAMREYASLLGEDGQALGALADSERLLNEVAAASPAAKAATHAAMRRHRGSKDFGSS
jgi:Ca-activated chloride channel family protein